MKKITFILFALIAGTTFAQDSADALTSADIVSPITIVKTVNFNFGQVSNAGGTVIIATDNTVTGTATKVGTITPTAAAFTVNATDQYTYAVSLPADVTLVNQTGSGNEEMTVNALGDDSSLKGTGSDETFGVGGTLTVGSSQTPGYYKGTMTVGVSYN